MLNRRSGVLTYPSSSLSFLLFSLSLKTVGMLGQKAGFAGWCRSLRRPVVSRTWVLTDWPWLLAKSLPLLTRCSREQGPRSYASNRVLGDQQVSLLPGGVWIAFLPCFSPWTWKLWTVQYSHREQVLEAIPV